MDYKLAKRLKDAGWPQPKCFVEPERWRYSEDEFEFECAYAPTTDELIEALGDCLSGVRQKGDRWLAWTRYIGKHQTGAEGESIRLALSELWLMPEVQAELKRLSTD
jgi:hypothetical protein